MKQYFDSIKDRVHSRFDLRHDQANNTEIDLTFRNGVEFRGTNLWVLIFAIFVASIGLNVNSTAVIIGAMLISPLMGPIMALGYGAGINDSGLMRSSLFNLSLAVLLSLLTSTAYFLISPLSQAHSELLARTTPSIWDVLIALFGGLAGVIGVTRHVKSNLIPGVAIATALMPPLCTAGYGLSVGNWQYFGGAIYLFAINCVFIAIATLMMVRFMGLPNVKLLPERSRLKRRTIIGMIVLCTLIPSIYLAIDLVRKEIFESNTSRFLSKTFRVMPNVLVISHQSDHRNRQISINLTGDRLAEGEIMSLQNRLKEFNLVDTQLIVMQSGQEIPDINAVKNDLLNEFKKFNYSGVEQKDAQILSLQNELMGLKKYKNLQLFLNEIADELKAQFPQALELKVSSGFNHTSDSEKQFLLVQIKLKKSISVAEQKRMQLSIKQRASAHAIDEVLLEIKTQSIAKKN
jgi:uncharacterized hydrophobic protein (TIGR00271 family)